MFAKLGDSYLQPLQGQVHGGPCIERVLINIRGFNSITYLYVPGSAQNKVVANRCVLD